MTGFDNGRQIFVFNGKSYGILQVRQTTQHYPAGMCWGLHWRRLGGGPRAPYDRTSLACRCTEALTFLLLWSLLLQTNCGVGWQKWLSWPGTGDSPRYWEPFAAQLWTVSVCFVLLIVLFCSDPKCAGHGGSWLDMCSVAELRTGGCSETTFFYKK